MDEINNFEKLKALVEDMQAHKNDLGIDEDGITLDFYGYLAQANAGATAAEVYANCFS